ncbi:MAG: AAA family ATPase [Candidatus Heimdallarchaeaceae archaeon]
MLEEYLNQIQEGYIISDKNISVNLADFKSGKRKKLLIFGTAGSGKTTLGEMLSKRYSIKWISIDSLWWRMKQKYFKDAKHMKGVEPELKEKVREEVVKHLRSNERLIIEGIDLLELYDEEAKYRKLILNQSMIILGLSSLRAGIRAGKRNKGRIGEDEGWERIGMIEFNFKRIEPLLKKFRKDIMKLPSADIKEIKV